MPLQKLQTNWKKLRQTIKSMGFKETIYWIWFGYLRKNTFYAWGLELDDLSFKDPELDANIAVRKFTGQEWAAERGGRMNLPREFYYDEVYGLGRCYVGYYQGRIAHICWVLQEGDHSRVFEIGDGEVQPEFAVTPDEFRRKGLLGSVFRYLLLDLKSTGLRRVLGAHTDSNKAMMRNLSKLGFKHLGRINHWGPIRPKFKGRLSRQAETHMGQ